MGTSLFRLYSAGTLACAGLLLIWIPQGAALPVSGSLTLAWDANDEPRVAGYNVYRSEESGAFEAPPLNGKRLVTELQFTDSTVEEGRTYYYTVTAVSTDGLQSAYADEVEAVIPGTALEGMIRIGNGRAGEGAAQAGTGDATAALSLITHRPHGTLVSEAVFAASEATESGRIPADIRSSSTTGIAITNPHPEAVALSFYFTDADGADFHRSETWIPANGWIRAFLNEAPFAPEGPEDTRLTEARTFTFSASMPVAAVAIQGFVNERSEFLMEPVPVVRPGSTDTPAAVLPHYVDGDGWKSRVVLVNPNGATLAGTVEYFLGSGPTPDETLPFTIPPRSSVTLETTPTPGVVRSGWARIQPASGMAQPSAHVSFSFVSDGVTHSKGAMPAAPETSTAFLYVEGSESGTPLSLRSGLAISNPAPAAALVRLELLTLDGRTAGPDEWVSIPPRGQMALFLDEILDLGAFGGTFEGVLRVSGPPTALTGIRMRVNERGDFVFAMTPPIPAPEGPVSTAPRYSYSAGGDGYLTEIVEFPLPGS